MKIKMLNADSIDTVDRVFAPSEDNGFREYLRDRSRKVASYLEKAGSRIRDGFRERARQIFEEANSSSVLKKAREALRALKGVKRANAIYQVDTIDDLRSVGSMMQRFLMADPVVRKRLLKQTIDGYSETFVNVHGKDIGDSHYDYRRVVDGVYREELNSDGEKIYVNEVFYEALLDEDRDLDAGEQFDILDAWDLQRLVLAAGLDPTNRLGGDVG